MNIQPVQPGARRAPLSAPPSEVTQEVSKPVQDGVSLSGSPPAVQPEATGPAAEPVSQQAAPAPATPAASPEIAQVGGWQLAGAQPPGPSQPLKGFDRSNMDPTVDPNADFFHYAMGNYLKAHPIPESEASWGVDAEVVESVRTKLNSILEQAAANPADADEKRMGDFYASGMNTEARDRLGVTPIQGLLDQNAAIGNLKELQGQVARLHGTGINALFDFGSGQDASDQSKVTGQAYQGGLGLPNCEYYTKTDDESVALREKYQQHVERTFALLGKSPEDAARAAETVMRIENRLAEASLTPVEMRDPKATYNPMDAEKLAKLNGTFDWQQYFTDLGRPDMGFINVATPRFFEGLDKTLTEVPLDDWKTYLDWTVLRVTSGTLSSDFVNEDFAFKKELTGAKSQPPLWRTMVAQTDDYLGDSLGRQFVTRHFPPEAKAKVKGMIENVIGALRERIPQLDWMSPETQTSALEKLNKMRFKIGYPDVWKDYSNFQVDRENYAGNVLEGKRFLVQEDLQRIGAPVDKNRWLMTASTVNAYYEPSNNEFVMPAGILQPPYFDMEQDDAINYGITAGTIGHEMTHGFDDQGALYDADGNMRNWWTDADKANFDKLTTGIRDQFSEFSYQGTQVNGQLVLGESVADLGGLEIAFMGYQRARQQAREQGQPELPSPDGFTPEQRFFLGYAQSWGTNMRPEKAKTLLANDPHPLAEFRVKGPLANMPDFLNAFSIPPGSPMYRPVEQRNRLWGPPTSA